MEQSKTLNELGRQIEIIRERRGNLSLYRIAKNAGIAYSYLYRIMRGQVKPSREKLADLCRAMACSPEEKIEIYKAAGYYLSPEEANETIHAA